MSNLINPENIFVIIPAHNEHSTIVTVVQDLLSCNYEIVVIDDGSTESLHSLLKSFPVYFLRHEINLGQGAAIQTGIDFALLKKADYIVTFDGDGQHKAEDIDKMITAVATDKFDIVLGSRFINATNSIPWKRKILLKLARFVNYIFTGLFLTDAHNGLRVMTKAASEKIRIRENGMAHATEILSAVKKNKLRYTEVAVTIYYTDYSKKKGQNLWSSFRIFFDIVLNKIFQ
jgi:polyprenyl-phospho-N-acetylgalactosaminyl synthase